MKKKQVNTVLVIAIALIWGVVGYRLYHYFFSYEPQLIRPLETIENLNRPPVISKDTFSLVTITRDPFLDGYGRPQRSFRPSPDPSRAIKKTLVKKKVPTPWPKITYLGYLQSNATDTKKAILRINDTLFRLPVGKVHQSISVKAIEKNRVVILRGREEKVFIK